MISIITPTFNSSENIENCVQSIVQQSYKEFEHIIIDKLSTDETLFKIRKIYTDSGLMSNLKIISEMDNGISDAFNKGIRVASGDIIGILNSDDLYYSSNLFEEVEKVFHNPNVQFIHGDLFFFDPVYGSNIRRPLKSKVINGYIYNHPTMFVRKPFYEKLGFYDTNFKLSMDFEFYCKISKYASDAQTSVYWKQKPLVQMNAGGTSWHNELQSIEEIKLALQKHGLWNRSGKNFYRLRKIRTLIKNLINKLGLKSLIKIWRNFKWKTKIKSIQ